MHNNSCSRSLFTLFAALTLGLTACTEEADVDLGVNESMLKLEGVQTLDAALAYQTAHPCGSGEACSTGAAVVEIMQTVTEDCTYPSPLPSDEKCEGLEDEFTAEPLTASCTTYSDGHACCHISAQNMICPLSCGTIFYEACCDVEGENCYHVKTGTIFM